MNKTANSTLSAAALRRRAEARLRQRAKAYRPPVAVGKSPADARRLLHELQVHQIELEMQNDELQQARDEMEAGLERFSDLYDFAPVGYFTFTREGRIRQVNLNGATLTGIERSRLVGQLFGGLVVADARPKFQDFLRRVFAGQVRQTGEFAVMRRLVSPRLVEINAQCSPSGNECRAVVMDITARKRAGAQLELLWDSASVLLSTDDPDSILAGLFAKVGPALGVDAYFSYQVDETGTALRLASWAGVSAETARARHQLPFGRDICGTVAQRLESVHVTQLQRSADPMVQSVKALGFRACASDPLTSGRLLLGTLSYGSRTKDHFEDDELAVLRTISHYVAVAYERLRIGDMLRAGEERYRTLFESMDEGYCIVEVIFDAGRKPVDYRYLEVNPAFEKHTGLSDIVGKRVREMFPNIETYWFETYGKVALTGKPIRFVNEAKAMHRWFDLYAFRVGGTESRKVAVLFNDITARKQTEDALRESRAQVAAYAGQLERQVAVRTAQLTAANRRLESSVQTIRRDKEKYRSLFQSSQQMQEKLRRLTRQVLSAQEDERRRISRELHDSVVQILVGINVELAALGRAANLGPQPLRAKIGRTQRLVAKSVNAVHDFARELRPAVLDDLGLIPALQAFMKILASRKNLKIRLTAFAGVEAMESDRRTVLYRVAQEALTNVGRHAQASIVDVHITEISGTVRMEVHDNGRSFPVERTLSAKTNKRLGLLGLRERVEMVGGTVTIESAPGQGTTVRAELPFRQGGAT